MGSSNSNTQNNNLIKYVLVGEYGSGRTSLQNRYIDNQFNQNVPFSIGCDFKTKTLQIEGQTFKVQVWDPSGSQRFKKILHLYFKKASALIILFDITSNNYQNFEIFFQSTIKYQDEGTNVVIVASKIDQKLGNQAKIEEIKRFAFNNQAQYYEISSKDNVGINQMFHQLNQKSYQKLKNKSLKNQTNKSKWSLW